jgi:hypothetical protein
MSAETIFLIHGVPLDFYSEVIEYLIDKHLLKDWMNEFITGSSIPGFDLSLASYRWNLLHTLLYFLDSRLQIYTYQTVTWRHK